MNLCLVSDIHCRWMAPVNRREDDFFEDVVMNKVEQVLKIATSRKCKAILQAGDLFDSPDPSKFVVSRLLRLFRSYDIPLLTVLGQHDMMYRNWKNVNRTATYLLESAGVALILGLDGAPFPLDKNVQVHGLSFDQDFNMPESASDSFNILVAHASVGDKELYPGHKLPGLREFAHKHKGFDVILLGDYHFAFQDTFAGTQIFNTGVLLRKSIAEKEQKPNVIIYDTDTRKAETVELDYTPWPEAFRIVEKQEGSDQKLQELLDIIREEKSTGVSFVDNLRTYYANTKISKKVKDQIALEMEKAGVSQKEQQELA